jgi:hypothetical protein
MDLYLSDPTPDTVERRRVASIDLHIDIPDDIIKLEYYPDDVHPSTAEPLAVHYIGIDPEIMSVADALTRYQTNTNIIGLWRDHAAAKIAKIAWDYAADGRTYNGFIMIGILPGIAIVDRRTRAIVG